jgi:sugar-specific transcriptional regulator TrmB
VGTDDKTGKKTATIENVINTPTYILCVRLFGDSGHMQEDVVVKLENFGFTVNQAKVYLSIVQSGATHVGRISKNTQLHRQDIYKLLPKLEKMGLITKTIDKPFMIEAIPVEKALDSLVSSERKKAQERISHLENNLKDVVNELQEQPHIKEETRFTLLTTDESIKNRGRLSFKKIKKECLLVTSIKHIHSPSMRYFRDFLQTIANKKAKTRLIIVTSDDNDSVNQTLEKLAPITGQFSAKSINKTICKNYQIIDNKEVWIVTEQKTETGYPCILWTNDQNIIDVYKENFKKAWNRARSTIALGLSVSAFAWVAVSLMELLN